MSLGDWLILFLLMTLNGNKAYRHDVCCGSLGIWLSPYVDWTNERHEAP